MLVWRRKQPSAAKADSLQSSHVRPKGRTLQRNEFFRSLESRALRQNIRAMTTTNSRISTDSDLSNFLERSPVSL
jgi:hypothetical protein